MGGAHLSASRWPGRWSIRSAAVRDIRARSVTGCRSAALSVLHITGRVRSIRWR